MDYWQSVKLDLPKARAIRLVVLLPLTFHIN